MLTEEGAAVARPAAVASAIEDQEHEAYVPDMASTFVTQAVDVEPVSAPAAASVAPVGGGQKVIAPMPGKVLDIIAKVGDAVKTGDTLCNLEAMKMKSPIRSTADGTVAQILASEGQSVNYGDVLFVLA
ncbi:MAG: biotin/lipoyl-binding protein [Anaerolineae bacterium]|nr:biotin/lipoyl-binding protein [Anaerolineae bacterium]